MTTKHWSRRQLVQEGSCALAALAVGMRAEGQQLPRPEPLEDARLTLVTTTEASPWQTGTLLKPSFAWEMLNLDVGEPVAGAHPMEGFGGCFNELGWTSLSALSEGDRETVMHELFDPKAGARFTYCRMPIGANDFALDAYSYDEIKGDFQLEHFSIEHDRKTLVPFIQAALKQQPQLRVWASPWTPPSWMKRNGFYAEAKAMPGSGFKENGIRDDQVGHEGEDMFIQEPRYFEAYARYFGRFVDAYRAEGIRVGMVMPQNEFNSAQNFPSCTWTPAGLARFLHALGPEMTKRGVDVFFGTDERGDPRLVEAVMADAEASKYIKGVGMQWAGKGALPAVAQEFPKLVVFQSEQECGNGENSWSYTSYCWQLMKLYFRNGASGYMYWNISTNKGGMSTWGWRQNALVSVDPEAKTYKYNHDYYLLKHLTHYVEVGATRVETSGTCDDALGFRNPDGTVVVLLRNAAQRPQLIAVRQGIRNVAMELPADSVGTLVMRPG